MVKRFIPLKQFIRDSNKGFTLLELLVALVIASIVLGLALKLIVDQRKLVVADQARTQINQNLRASIDLVGTDIKQAGERLAGNTQLPVVQVINGGVSGGVYLPDELVLQRKGIDETLPVCKTITAGSVTSMTSTIDVSFDPGNAICPFSKAVPTDTLPVNVKQWQKARCSKDGNNICDNNPVTPNTNKANDICLEQGGTDNECLWAYIYDPTNNRGEFFLYALEDSYLSGSQTRYRIYRTPSATAVNNTWQYTYTYTAPTVANPNPINPVLYILEERRYRLANNPSITGDKVLELILNQQTRTPIRLVNQLSNFQVDPLMIPPLSTTSPGSFNQTTPFGDNWQKLQAIKISLTARNPSQGAINVPNLNISAQFFPRNAASKR